MIGARFGEVLASAKSGGDAAFATLWTDGNPALLRYLRVIAPGAAEDVAAETWLQVVRGLASFRGEEPAWRAWLFAIARRRAIDDGRRRARRATVPLEEQSAASGPLAPDPATIVLEQLDTEAALALVATLPRQQAEVILLRVVAGLDVAQVARLLGRTSGSVRVTAHRGLRRLAELLSLQGVTG